MSEATGKCGRALATGKPCPIHGDGLTEAAQRMHRLVQERDQAREIAVTLEQQAAYVLELLESSAEGWLGNSANINAAIAVLRGDDAED